MKYFKLNILFLIFLWYKIIINNINNIYIKNQKNIKSYLNISSYLHQLKYSFLSLNFLYSLKSFSSVLIDSTVSNIVAKLLFFL